MKYTMPALFEQQSENSSLKNMNDKLYVSLNGSYSAYIASKSMSPYSSIENQGMGSIRYIDVEANDNYKVSYRKATFSPDIKDLLYKRYDNYAQSSNLWQKFSAKLIKLKDTIGDDLFGKLSFDQQLLMASTLGVIDDSRINSRQISAEESG